MYLILTSSGCRSALGTVALAVICGHNHLFVLQIDFSKSGLEVSSFSLRSVVRHVAELGSRGCF